MFAAGGERGGKPPPKKRALSGRAPDAGSNPRHGHFDAVTDEQVPMHNWREGEAPGGEDNVWQAEPLLQL